MTLAYRGMVAAPHALASEAGVEVLKAGGSAVDAAIAANAVLNVVYPHMSGIGGDAFWLIYDSAAREVPPREPPSSGSENAVCPGSLTAASSLAP